MWIIYRLHLQISSCDTATFAHSSPLLSFTHHIVLQNCANVDELTTFLDSLPQELSFQCVLKPLESAGSDDVFCCKSRQEAEVLKDQMTVGTLVLLVNFFMLFINESISIINY
jgi:hypothetical protein